VSIAGLDWELAEKGNADTARLAATDIVRTSLLVGAELIIVNLLRQP
jgi:hypothetical protein